MNYDREDDYESDTVNNSNSLFQRDLDSCFVDPERSFDVNDSVVQQEDHQTSDTEKKQPKIEYFKPHLNGVLVNLNYEFRQPVLRDSSDSSSSSYTEENSPEKDCTSILEENTIKDPGEYTDQSIYSDSFDFPFDKSGDVVQGLSDKKKPEARKSGEKIIKNNQQQDFIIVDEKKIDEDKNEDSVIKKGKISYLSQSFDSEEKPIRNSLIELKRKEKKERKENTKNGGVSCRNCRIF